jgi:TonB family protein
VWRSFFASFVLHGVMVLALLVLTLTSPPPPRYERMEVRLVQPIPKPAVEEPEPATPAATPEPTPTPTPRATPTPEPKATAVPTPTPTPRPQATATPKPTPTPEPKIKKPTAETKEVLKEVKVVEEEPTPTPAPTPEPKATATPKPPAPVTPPPIDVSKLQTPPPAPKVSSKVTEIQASSSSDFSQTYYLIIQQKVESNFQHPLSRPGLTCRVKMTILRNGTIANSVVVKSSGNAAVDQYALDAIRRTSGKLPPLWDGLGKNSLDVTITFHYERRN